MASKIWRSQNNIKGRKLKIQKDFRDLTGRLIDIPKPKGCGTTNNGNTARRFFKDYNLSSKMTGLSETVKKSIYNTLCNFMWKENKYQQLREVLL